MTNNNAFCTVLFESIYIWAKKSRKKKGHFQVVYEWCPNKKMKETRG